MYTRCPSCGAEISFEPPADRESLPYDYKHRIRCPICGVTIGVKLNKPVSAVTTYPNLNPAPVPPPTQSSFEPVIQQTPATTVVQTNYSSKSAADSKAKKKRVTKKGKKYGTMRNVFMMLFSLVFVALSVVGYLIVKGTIQVPENFSWLTCAYFFDGISPIESIIKDPQSVAKLFMDGKLSEIILALMPSVLFVLSGLNFIVAFIAALGKKYGRAFNLIFSILICGSALTTFFLPFITIGDIGIAEYFKYIIELEYYLMLAFAAWGILQLLFALIFLKSLKVKKKKKR